MGQSWTTEELFNPTYFAVLGSILILGKLLLNWFNSKLTTLLKLQQANPQISSGMSVFSFLWRLPLLMIVALFIRTNLQAPSVAQLVLAGVIFLMTYYVPYKIKAMLIQVSGK